ncbi:hypothetical protein N7455_006113 [Penicillium solitum]|uniref:uncharacterized protein n=1 Tax=Penicillium solitum TaxID=60172 RepID=UPI0017C5279B|nr:hypothetical protein HAV15_011612 [Penicillium sp. str. \
MHITTPRQGSPAIAASENSGSATSKVGFGMDGSASPEDNRRQPSEPSKVGNFKADYQRRLPVIE